ncbi:MAG: putative ceramide glucosyltransferase [Acidobacteriaceae bacterium]|nr:putative ceramide glucosyltransferase [Acidobacteriaceae bacterium]
MVVAGALYFRRQRIVPDPSFVPPVSLLKPLHGAEPNLAEHLEGFFKQDYPTYEILFCARTANDPGLQIARELAARHPSVPAHFLTSGEPPFANAKVASLDRMAQAARHSILVVSDSDVRVGPDYLRAVVAPFADPQLGVVTCPYRGIPSRAAAAIGAHPATPRASALWAQLEAVGMSIEMTAGVLVANMLEGMQFALGPTMAVRSECVQEIGGFNVLGQYCADDFLLGNLVAAKGHRVLFSHYAIDHIVLNTGFIDSMRHQVRWSKSTRFSRPKGHFGTALTFAMPFSLLAFAAALGLHWPVVALAALVWGILNRMLLAAVVGSSVVRERSLGRTLLLYPLRDLMGFGFWSASYGSRQILWRGEEYVLENGGYMRPLHAKSTSGDSKRSERETALTL